MSSQGPEGEIILYICGKPAGMTVASRRDHRRHGIDRSDTAQMILMTRPNLPEHTNNLLVKAAEKLINWSRHGRDMERVLFSDNYHFEFPYYVMAKDEDAARAFLDDTRPLPGKHVARYQKSLLATTPSSLARGNTPPDRQHPAHRSRL